MTKTILVATLALLAGCNRGGRAETKTATMTTTSAPERQQALPLNRTIRIVAIGDSLAYGTGDESGKGISGWLEDELRARGVPDVDAVNLGVNGAQTSDLAARMRVDRVRSAIASADVIILSIGANDLFRNQRGREETLRDPIGVASRILERVVKIVGDLRAIAPNAHILILGGYNPVPKHTMAALINQYLDIWDATLADRFKNDPRITVVQMDDIVTPQRLSRFDGFHPGRTAYEEAAKRIAKILTEA